MERIRVLASPVRQEIVDAIEAGGASTIAEVARAIGRPADGLYHHVRALLGAGLLAEVGTRRSEHGREQGEYDLTARPMTVRFVPGEPERAEAIGGVVGASLRLAEREFRAALGRADASTTGPGRTVWANRAKGWLNAERRARVAALLAELDAVMREGAPGDGELFAMTYVVVPVRARPADRREGADSKGAVR